jgi:hypothetical protein
MENNHTQELGWISLKAELLKDCMDDIAAAIRMGGIDAKTLTEVPANGLLGTDRMKKKLDGLSALRFLRCPAGLDFCESVGINPSALMVKAKSIAAKGESPYAVRRTANTDRRGAYKDLTGRRYGRLVVISPYAGIAKGSKEWLCRCDCGAECWARSGKLIQGRKQSCGRQCPLRLAPPKRKEAA